VDLPSGDLDSVVADIAGFGVSSAYAVADVSRAGEMSRSVSLLTSQLGIPTLAVNAAGIANSAPAEDLSFGQWQRVIDVDLTGVFLSCQAEGRVMLEHERGSFSPWPLRLFCDWG
jgi:NAD(P)-dependent dehydrogenase (short-subunit alcohol dehydrogenase family)